MKDYSVKTKKNVKKDYSVSKKVEPEYVLRVNSDDNNDISIKVEKKNVTKEIPQKTKKRKKKNRSRGKKFILLLLLFLVCFIVSVTIGYNLIFKLFEM